MSPDGFVSFAEPRPPGAAAAVGAVAQRLRRTFAATEARFAEIGRNLEQSVGLLGRVARSFDALLADFDSAEMRAAAAALAGATAQVSTLAGTLRDGRGAFAPLTDATRSIAGDVGRIRQTVDGVAMLAINAKIIMAQIESHDPGFSAFAVEILRLADLARASLDRFGSELVGLDASLHAAEQAQAGFQARQTDAMRAVPARLARSLEAIAQQGHRAAAAAAAVRRQSAAIRDRIGAAVVALQICDITRQRVEHADQALAALRAAAAPGAEAAWWQSLPETRRQAIAAAVHRLQAAQLDDAAQRFRADVAAVEQALAALAHEACEMVQLGTATYGAEDRRHGSFLEQLEQEVGEARGLLAGYLDARRDADQVLAAMADAVTGLRRHMRTVLSIEADIRLMGLNTTLRCARLGARGQALAVVAQEMRAYANSTAEDTGDVTAGLGRLVDTARQLTGSAHGSAAEAAAAADAMTASIARFGALGRAESQALSDLERDGRTVEALLQQTAALTAAHAEISAALQAAAAELSDLAEAAGAADDDDLAAAAPLFAEIAAAYTMDAERAVHARFAPGGALPAAVEAASELDDILF